MKNNDYKHAAFINAVGLFWLGVTLTFYCADKFYQISYGAIEGAEKLIGNAVAISVSLALFFFIKNVKLRLFLGTNKLVSVSMVACFLCMAIWELHFNRVMVSAEGSVVIGIVFSFIFYTVEQLDD